MKTERGFERAMQLLPPPAGAAGSRVMTHKGGRGRWAMMKTLKGQMMKGSASETDMQIEPSAAVEATLPMIDLIGKVSLLGIATTAHIMQGAPRLRVGHSHLSKERQLMMMMCGITTEPLISHQTITKKRYKVCLYKRRGD